MTQIQKNKDPERWLLRKRNGQGPSEATAAMFKSEREGSITASGSLEHQSSQSLGPGGRRLRAVDTGGLFGDDDDATTDVLPSERIAWSSDSSEGLISGPLRRSPAASALLISL